MPSTYTSNLGIEKPANGEQSGTWGNTVNSNSDILDRAINGSVTLTLAGTSSTLTTSDGSLSDGQFKLLVLGGAIGATHTITIAPSDAQKIYFVRNTTSQTVTFTQGSGGNASVLAGDSGVIYANGGGATAAVVNFTNTLGMSGVDIDGGTIDGTAIGEGTASTGAFTTLTASSTATLNTLASSGATITGGTINNTPIGGTTAAAGTFTGLTSPTLTNAGTLALSATGANSVTVATNGSTRITVGSGGNVGVGGTANAAAILDLQSTTLGFLAPRMTTTQRNAIVSPVQGLLIYNTTLTSYQVYNGTSWTSVGGGATGGGSDQVFIENEQTVTTSYTIPTGKNAMTTGPITINSGVVVTVPTGSNWVVL